MTLKTRYVREYATLLKEDIISKTIFHRKLGQGSEAETKTRDLRAELLQAEAVHFARKNGVPESEAVGKLGAPEPGPPKRLLEGGPPGSPGEGEEGDEEDPEAKRRRVLEETRDIDADSELSESESSEEDRSGFGHIYTE